MMQEIRPASAAAQIGRTEAPQNPKTTIRKITLAGVCALAALALGTGSANATVFSGSATFQDNTNNNALYITASPSTSNVSFTETKGQSYEDATLLTLTLTDSAPGTLSDQVEVQFSFSQPGTGSGTSSGTASDTVYNFFGQITNGYIVWSNPSFITFNDGAELEVSIADTYVTGILGTKWVDTVAATFTDESDPIPEPASLALLGIGMIGMGVVARRRRSSTPNLPV